MNFREQLKSLAEKRSQSKRDKSSERAKSLVEKGELRSPKLEAKEQNLARKTLSKLVEDFPSADFSNESVKDGASVYVNEGKIISGRIELSEELIVLNAWAITSYNSSGRVLDVTLNAELQKATVSASAITDAPAYRITVTKNSELTGGRLGLKLSGQTADDAQTIINQALVEFEKGADMVEAILIPYITDASGVQVPVIFHADPAAGSGTGHYIEVTGIVNGMKVSVDAVSKLDILALN